MTCAPSCGASGARDSEHQRVSPSASPATVLLEGSPALLCHQAEPSAARMYGLHEWGGCPKQTHRGGSWAPDRLDHSGSFWSFCVGCDNRWRGISLLCSPCSVQKVWRPGVKLSLLLVSSR